ncbi:hypothetical protein ACFLY6_02965 [Candidatus Dependentiae bacterium]
MKKLAKFLIFSLFFLTNACYSGIYEDIAGKADPKPYFIMDSETQSPYTLGTKKKKSNVFTSIKTYLFDSMASEVGYIHNLRQPLCNFPLTSLRENTLFLSLIDGFYADFTATWKNDYYAGLLNVLYRRDASETFPGLYWAVRANINVNSPKMDLIQELMKETSSRFTLEAIAGIKLIDSNKGHLSIHTIGSGRTYHSINNWGFAPALGFGVDGSLTIWNTFNNVRSIRAFFASERIYKKTLPSQRWSALRDEGELSDIHNSPTCKKSSSGLAALGYFDEKLGFAIKVGMSTMVMEFENCASDNFAEMEKTEYKVDPYIGIDFDNPFSTQEKPTRFSLRGSLNGFEAKVGFSF